MKEVRAHPLAWPAGWKRIPLAERKPAAFNVGGGGRPGGGRSLEVSDGVKRVFKELEAFGIKSDSVVVSTNLKPTLSGAPHETKGMDCGVAVYWERAGTRVCMAIDRYTRVADNLAAVAATLEAMRAIERHGGGTILERAFTGFAQLAAPEQPWQVLGIKHDASKADVEKAFRRLAAEHHPDRGGDEQQMARINAARDALLN